MLNRILITIAFLPGIGAVSADAAELAIYWTTNPAVALGAPPATTGAWNLGGGVGGGGGIAPGQTFWVAFLNTERSENYKHVLSEIRKAAPGLPKVRRGGRANYVGFDGNGNPVPKKNTDAGSGGGKMFQQYRFGPPQPAWERFKYVSRETVNTTFDFRAWSACTRHNRQGGVKKFSIDEGYFGAIGAMAGPQQITSMSVFPSTNSVDTSIAPHHTFPPTSGIWTAQFVNVDPDGNSRPRGGVRWSTNGAGLGPDVLFSAGFDMNESREEFFYDLYAYDTAAGEYERHLLDISVDTVPSLGFYGLICLVALLMGGGVLMLRRT